MAKAEQRRKRLMRKVRREGVDAFLVTDEVNVTYLTGFSGDSSWLAIGPDWAVMLSDGRYTIQLSEECPELDVLIRKPGQTLVELLARLLGRVRLRRLAFERAAMTVATLGEIQDRCERLELVGWDNVVEQMRMRKDAEELKRIRIAIRMAEEAFCSFHSELQLDWTEKQMSDRLEYCVRAAGGRCGAFESIVALGPRSALPHARPGRSRAARAKLLLVDWGAREFLYHSDLTRIVPIRRISTKLVRLHRVVCEAQRRAVDRIKPGVAAKTVDAAARKVIERAGFGRFFTHGTGHGVGLKVHEAPLLKDTSELVLQPGMVLTVEPGIYLKGWGGVRIEDMVLVTRDGPERLSSLSHELERWLVE